MYFVAGLIPNKVILSDGQVSSLPQEMRFPNVSFKLSSPVIQPNRLKYSHETISVPYVLPNSMRSIYTTGFILQ
jgi:hypothetical protein